MRAVRSFLVRQRVRFMRGYGLCGCFGIGYLVAAKLQEQLAGYYEVSVHLRWLFPAGVGAVWLVGYLESRLGFWQEEQRFIWKNNPAYRELAGKGGKSRQNATERPERPQGGVGAQNGHQYTPKTRTPHGASTGPSA